MKRRDFLRMVSTTAAATAVSSAAGRTAVSVRKRPNILYIMSDDHASHALSCYGSKINKTPNMDRIANEGMRFDNCFCTNSICGPCRAVVLTGKYSHLNGFVNNGNTFDGSQQTFPKLLRKAGYTTAMVGKWHLKSEPTGFDYWHVLPGQGAYTNPPMKEMGKMVKHQGYTTDIITDIALKWLDRRDKTKPFCLMLHHKAPHRNWQPNEKYKKIFAKRTIPLPDTFDDDHSGHKTAAKEAAMTIDRHLTPKDVKMAPPAGLSARELKIWKYQRYMRDYLACVQSVDDNVGRVLDYLDKNGLADDTIIVYTSDQGFYLGDHNWFDKRFIYEESLRSPFIIRYPREIKPGSVSDAMILNLDFAETFLDYAGVPTPSDMQGVSIRPVLQDKKPADWRKAVYYHYYEFPGAHSVKRHYGIRAERYTLVHYYPNPASPKLDEWELFDLEKDPKQLKQCYEDPAYADVITDLKKQLYALRAHYGDTKETDAKLEGKRKPRKKPGTKRKDKS